MPLRAALPERKLRPDFQLEDAAAPTACCGIDEVGRGPLAGPVVAAAVILDRARLLSSRLSTDIHDSKKLTAKKRQEIAKALPDYAEIGIGLCDVEEIDRINILQAALTAMGRAYDNLPVSPPLALVDGNRPPRLPCLVQTVIKGDAVSLSIAAASIVAKVYRDDIMARLAQDFPAYGWEKNAGYGTSVHMKAIEINGITPHHRRSFAPISKQLLKVNSANS